MSKESNKLLNSLATKLGRKIVVEETTEPTQLQTAAVEETVEVIQQSATEETQTRKFTIPPTCDKLDSIPKNVHYIQEPEPGTFFVVKLDEAPDRNRNPELIRQLLDNMYIYINDGDEEFAVKKLTGAWPYFEKPESDKVVKLGERKSKNGESLVKGFSDRLHKLKYVNGTLMYEHDGEQFRIQIGDDTYTKFSFYLHGYDTWNMAVKIEVSWWILSCTDRGSEIANGIHADVSYKHLRDRFQEGLYSLMKKDSEETSEDKIRFLQGKFLDTPHHDYKDHDGNPCGIMEYWCSKTWTNEHYTLMTQKGDRAWDVYRWIIGYITSMDFTHKNVDFRHFIWFACRLSSIGKSKMLEKCFPSLVVDPNPANGKDTFSVEELLSSPLMVADDGDLAGLAKNDSYSTILNKRVGNSQIYVRIMRKNPKFIKRTVFNMSISNVEPPKELYSGDNTNIMTSKCRYVYVNLSDAIYHDENTSILNIEEVARKIGRTIPEEFVVGPYTPEVDMFKSDCLRFYKANPHFMDKYLGAIKQANTSGAKTCFEDYIDAAEANSSWDCDYDNDKLMPLGTLFIKQLRCEDDYATLKKYFEQWAENNKLVYEKAKRRINGISKSAVSQPMVSKEMIMNIYNKPV